MNAASRKNVLWLHTWTGLMLGIVIVLLAGTGAGLVLRPQLDLLVNWHLLRTPACDSPLPLDELANRARAAHQGTLYTIEAYNQPGRSVSVQFANLDYVYVSPCTGKVLGTQNQYGGFFGTMDWLHRFLFIGGQAGRSIAGVVTLAFLVALIAGGLYLWWPRSRAERRTAFKFNYRLPGIARTLSLHKIIGLYTSVLMAIITVTAVPLAFLPVKNLIYHYTGYVPPIPPTSTVDHSGRSATMQSAWIQARKDFPGLKWATFYYPVAANDSIKAEILEQNAPHEDAKSYMYVDRYSGKVLQEVHYGTEQNPGRKIYLYCIALHSALVGGIPYQLLLFIACLGVPLQTYSGFSPWIRKKLKRNSPQSLSVRVVTKTIVAENIVCIELESTAGGKLPRYSPGSHIDVHIAPGITRQYSLCGNPGSTDRYAIGVLHTRQSRGGSIAMHNAISVGDRITISEPRNFFSLDESAAHSLLFAGGIGITPILAMAERLATIHKDFTLHYCVHSIERAAFVEQIKESAFSDNVVWHISDQNTRVDFANVIASAHPDTHVYLCGPTEFTESGINAAKAQGLPEANIHCEYFSAAAHDMSSNTAFDVKIASSGDIIHIPRDRSVAEVLACRGIEIPTSCGEGICGTCLTGVISGEVEHNDMILGSAERAENTRFTPCCSRARCALLVLDL